MENYFSPPGEAALPLAPPSAPSPSDSSSGLDPNTVPRPSLTRKAKVLYDYDAAEKNELSLLADEVSVRACYSDEHVFSPQNSHIKLGLLAMRINALITKRELAFCLLFHTCLLFHQ